MHARRTALGILLTGALFALPAAAAAQGGVLLNGSVAAAVTNGSSSVLFGGGAGYQFNESFGLGVELTHLPSLRTDYGEVRCCVDSDGSATVFTTNVRIQVPTASERLIPFVVAGGGVASVTSRYHIAYAVPMLSALTTLYPGIGNIPIRPSDMDLFQQTQTSMALTLGGGVTFLLTEHVGIDADLRILQLMGNPDRSIGRFGGGVSFRF